MFKKSNQSGWWYTYPSEKYDFVSWDDDIPNIWKNNIHVPNHQSVDFWWVTPGTSDHMILSGTYMLPHLNDISQISHLNRPWFGDSPWWDPPWDHRPGPDVPRGPGPNLKLLRVRQAPAIDFFDLLAGFCWGHGPCPCPCLAKWLKLMIYHI